MNSGVFETLQNSIEIWIVILLEMITFSLVTVWIKQRLVRHVLGILSRYSREKSEKFNESEEHILKGLVHNPNFQKK